MTVSASDPALPGSTSLTAAFSLEVTDVNEPPAALSLTKSLTALPETSDTSSRIKVADIAISDDALGNNGSPWKADASSFEVDGTELFLKAETELDYESKAAYTVTVSASDPALPGNVADGCIQS